MCLLWDSESNESWGTVRDKEDSEEAGRQVNRDKSVKWFVSLVAEEGLPICKLRRRNQIYLPTRPRNTNSDPVVKSPRVHVEKRHIYDTE